MEQETLDILEFDVKLPSRRKKTIMQDLDFIEENTPLPSSILSKRKEDRESKKAVKKALKKERQEQEMADCGADDDWVSTLVDFEVTTKKNTRDLFGTKKKEKKKKKKKGGIVDHKKDFEMEVTLLKNLQYEQDKFVASLQKKYDQMEASKSTARGVGKFTTDLIQSITSARSLSRQLVTDIISTKKTIADLDFKERKEFGKQGADGVLDASGYASNFLKEMLANGRNNIDGNDGPITIDSGDNMDDFFDDLDSSLGKTERSSDVETYLKYENENPVIKVIFHTQYEDSDDLDEQYDFIAMTESGQHIPDYPLPLKTKLSINKSTGRCKDKLGNSYEIIFD